jgi:hypothetical protein
MHDSPRLAVRPILSPEDIEHRFERLQSTLPAQWKLIGSLNQYEQTMVVVPSISLDLDTPGLVLQAYEERFLFLLLLLRKPRMRVIYVTSQPILPSILGYYLGLLPGVISSHAQKRFFDVTPLDGSARPLSAKLLERPRVLEKIRGLVPNRAQTHLVPYNTTALERELAVRLGIPMYGADPKFFPLGTKSGSRRLFQEEGVPHPIGIENLASVDDAVHAIQRIRAERPGVAQVLVKLNEGVSGEGNALVDLAGLPAPGAPDEERAVRERVERMSFESPSVRFDWYAAKLAERGGVVEERITGEELRSPSVQMRVTPFGELELLSTHDQLLGGPSGQSYLGCTFPADRAYAAAITREAAKIGKRLAKEGVFGRFALDFVVVRRAGESRWDVYAIEINLRKGGTTHPYLTLQFLTDGTYHPEDAAFRTILGREKCYVATDHLENPVLRALTPDDLFDVTVRHGLHFNHSTQTGVVFHMMATLSECGRIGLTAIGDTPADAQSLYERTARVLEMEAKEALFDRGLPRGR